MTTGADISISNTEPGVEINQELLSITIEVPGAVELEVSPTLVIVNIGPEVQAADPGDLTLYFENRLV